MYEVFSGHLNYSVSDYFGNSFVMERNMFKKEKRSALDLIYASMPLLYGLFQMGLVTYMDLYQESSIIQTCIVTSEKYLGNAIHFTDSCCHPQLQSKPMLLIPISIPASHQFSWGIYYQLSTVHQWDIKVSMYLYFHKQQLRAL